MMSFVLGLMLALDPQASAAQPANEASAMVAKPDFELDLDRQGRVIYAVARNASVSDVVKRLQAALKVPVRVSGGLTGKRVTFSKLDQVSLNDLLGRVAPVVYLDTREPWGKGAELLAIHLLETVDETPPVQPAAAMVIEGTTGDASDKAVATAEPAEPEPPKEGPFLRVRRLTDGRLKIESREQGLGVLLFEAAQACGARFDLRISEAPMVSSFNVNGILPSQIPAQLGFPGVGMDIRRNIMSGEETLLRFFVDPVS